VREHKKLAAQRALFGMTSKAYKPFTRRFKTRKKSNRFLDDCIQKESKLASSIGNTV
jgi:hypothetical protein